MLSNNPRGDKFRLTLPVGFFKPEICEKYNKYLSLQNTYFQTIDQVINESIMRVSIPGLSQELISQNTAVDASAGSVGAQDVTLYPDTRPLEEVIESNTISVTFRHLDSYINYFFLMETWYRMYLSSDPAYTRFALPITVMSTDNHPVFVAMFSKCLFKSVPSLDLAYDNQARDFKDFTCEFAYSDFTILFDLPQGTAKSYKK